VKKKPKSSKTAAPSAAEFRQLIGLYDQGRLPDAISFGATLSVRYPRDASLDNVLGVVNARMGQLDAALRHYNQALTKRPGYAEAYNNRGNLLNRLGQRDEAIASFKAALNETPAYAEAHNNLGSALHDTGRVEEAISSYTEALKVKPNYAEAHNNLGNALMVKGKSDEALASFSRALQCNPGLPQAYNNIGNALRATGRYDEAIQNFRKAIQIWPEYAQAYLALGSTFNEQGLHRQAIDNIKKALQLNPRSAATHNDLGNALSDMGLHEEAVASYQSALDIDPDFAEVYSNLGNALCEFGDYDKAIASYERALQIKPEFAEAHNNLSKNKKYTRDDPQLQQMLERVASENITDSELMYLSFALGKAYEDVDDIDKSFEFLSQGNRLRKKELGYDIRSDQEHFALIRSFFDGESFPLSVGESTAGNRKQPIFIVGMPRSGTTLTEQILASHPQVFGAGELQAMGRMLLPVLRKAVATGDRKMTAEMLAYLRNTYLDELELLGGDEAFVTDKMPANFKWLGFILTAMPGAKIINLQRDPAASCWSMFKLLLSGNAYTNDPTDLAKYYHLYSDLMGFWRRKFPNQIYDLNYEALTENQEFETRKLLEYCGLTWSEKCLEFHKTKRRIHTASDNQVRKKMYTGSSEVWRKYEKHLAPMLGELKRRELV